MIIWVLQLNYVAYYNYFSFSAQLFVFFLDLISVLFFPIFLLFMFLTLIKICSQPLYLFPQYVVQSLNHVQLFATPWTTARQASLSITNSLSLLKLMSIKSMMSSNNLVLCRPLLLPPSVFASIREFPSESVLHIRWPEYWCFSFSISPFNEYSGLISFRIDVWSPCSPRDSQESSPIPQCESINSSALSLFWSNSHIHA